MNKVERKEKRIWIYDVILSFLVKKKSLIFNESFANYFSASSGGYFRHFLSSWDILQKAA